MAILIKRMLGYLLDLVISFLCYLLLFILIGLILSLFDQDPGISQPLKKYLNGISPFIDRLFTYLAFFIFLLMQDILLKNKALSRLVLNLKLVNMNGSVKPALKHLVIRNLIKAIFILDLIYFIFSKKMLHDKMSKTTVVEK